MTTCIPRAFGVPGAFNGPPHWLSDPTAVDYAGLDDPRWRGAFRVGYGGVAITPGGNDEEAAFRAIYHDSGGTKNLYLSWHVKFDPTVDASADVFHVGFEPQGAAAQPIIIKMTPYNVASDFEADPVGSIQISTINADGTVDTVLADDPDWIGENARAWCSLLSGGMGGSQPIAWAIQMVVPIDAIGGVGYDDAALDLPDAFKMWSSMRIAVPTTTDPDGYVDYNWPLGSDSVTVDLATLADVYPAVATWEDMSMDPACTPTVGVSLASTDIGARPAPDHQMFYKLTADLAPGEVKPVNTFFARPQNDTGAVINVGQVTARFRLANWGSISDVNASWADIPGGASIASTASIADGTKASDTAINFNWEISDVEIAPFDNGSMTSHQCMLVELSGPGLIFINDSVYRNMDFVEASVFERSAEISVLGTGPMPDGSPQREVYLAEEVRNMPARVVEPERPPKDPQGEKSSDSEIRRESHGPDDIQEQIQEAIKEGMTDQQRIELTTPTYRIHVYHDTGRRVFGADKLEHKILSPQASYGYYVHHKGPLTGWEQSLDGARRIEPGWYVIPVPIDGIAKVSNRIVAKEDDPILPDVTPGQGCLPSLTRRIRKLFKKLFGG